MVSKMRMSLDEFLEFARNKPSTLYNAYQRGYAALSSYGKTDGVWNFVYKQQNDKRKVTSLFGLDNVVDTFMTILKSGTQSPQERSKLTLFIGPAASGKSELEKTIAESLRVYSETERELYLPKVHVDDNSLDSLKGLFDDDAQFERFRRGIRSAFRDFKEVRLAPGVGPLTAMSIFFGSRYQDVINRLENLVSDVNKSTTEPWKQVYIDSGSVSSSAAWTRTIIENVLEDVFGDIEANKERIEKILTNMVSLDKANENEITPAVKPSVALGEKNLDYKVVFGGKLDYGLLGLMGGNNSNPLVFGAGVAGGQNRPSPRGNTIVFSEVLKAPESFKSSSLDLIQDRCTKFESYQESVDAIFLGTTNLDEYSQLGTNLKDYIMSRTNPLLFRSMVKLSAAERALKDMFEESARKLQFHYSPRFLKTLAYVWVMSGLDEEMNITLRQKAELYDGKKIPDLKITSEELLKRANSKSLLEITEGVKRGIPYREMRAAITKFIDYSRGIQSKLYGKRAEEEELCLDAVFGGENQVEWLEMFLNTMEGISDDTKARVHGEKGKAMINSAFDVYRTGVTEDVANCYAADNAVAELASKYVLQKYHEKLGHEKFTYNGTVNKTDKAFITNLEAKGHLKADPIGATIVDRIREKYNGEVNDTILKDISQAIIETNPGLVKGLIELLRPQPGVVLSADRDAIRRKLKEHYSYCDRKGGCSDVAYGLFDYAK